MNDAWIQCTKLYKQFPSQQGFALEDVSAEIAKGKVIGIVGPDGAGKTTFMRMIAALLTPTSGEIKVAGFDTLKQADQIHKIIGYMPQKFGLYEDLTVIQNLSTFADLKGLEISKRPEVFDRLLHFAHLNAFTSRLAGQLSGGMKQKLGLACSLIQMPPLLLLDEPTVGVDPLSRRELWKMIQKVSQEGISVIWSTAYLDEAEQCDEILLFNNAKLLYHGPPKKLTDKMEGRVFKVSAIQGSKREKLNSFFQREDVLDATIQGSGIRVCMKKDHTLHLFDAKVEKVPPRFEDAFIDMLGKKLSGASQIASSRHQVEKSAFPPVQAEHLVKKYGSFTAVEKISFTLNRGEIFGLLGPNGAGKTTTFKMLCGLIQPTSGKAMVREEDLFQAPAKARSQIGYMAQKFSLYSTLSVKQNLSFFAGAYNLNRIEREKKIQEMGNLFELTPFFSQTAESLPLGFQKRLSLCCANLHDPPILFLDEPTSGVDPLMRREFWNHIDALVAKGVTVLVTTHFMDEAEYCDRIALVYAGHIIHIDTPDALKQSVLSEQNPHPTLEEAFIHLIEAYESEHPKN